MKHNTIVVRWNEVSGSGGFVDLLPIDDVSPRSHNSVLDHRVLGPRGGRLGTARCKVTVRDKRVDLDYGPFGSFNRAQGMELGVLRLLFAASTGTTVRDAQWKPRGSRRFAGGVASVRAEARTGKRGPGRSNDALYEGALQQVLRETQKRTRVARRQCCEHYGTTCSVCGINFGRTYGHRAAGFIHVHHLTRLAARKRRHKVDPIRDLRPVCPNCHAVIHLRSPELSIQEVQALLQSGKRRRT